MITSKHFADNPNITFKLSSDKDKTALIIDGKPQKYAFPLHLDVLHKDAFLYRISFRLTARSIEHALAAWQFDKRLLPHVAEIKKRARYFEEIII